MTKKKSKFLALLLILLLSISTICYAENEVNSEKVPEPRTTDESVEPINETGDDVAPISTEGEPVTTSEEGDAVTTSEEDDYSDIYQDDLYLIDDEIVMDKLVDGNVYLMGKKVKITGQVAGNVYVFADNVEFENAYIQSSVYICANTVKFGAVSYDLYAACGSLEIPENFGVYRDIRVASNSITINGIVSRNAYLTSNNINVANTASIYGNLVYSSNSEQDIPKSRVDGDITFNQSKEEMPTTKDAIVSIVVDVLSAIVLAFIIFGLGKWLAPKGLEKANTLLANKWLPAFGIGLLSCIIVLPIIMIVLLCTVVAAPVALLLLGLYILLLVISIPIVTITIANAISQKCKFTKIPMQLLMIAIVSIVLYAIHYIPYVGGIINFILTILGFGILIISIFLPKFNLEKKDKLPKENS